MNNSGILIKISSSNIEDSIEFYRDLFKYEVQPEYTINKGGDYGEFSYVQMVPSNGLSNVGIGLLKDIDKPFVIDGELANNTSGQVATFMTDDFEYIVDVLKNAFVRIEVMPNEESDDGIINTLAFFTDPANTYWHFGKTLLKHSLQKKIKLVKPLI